MGESDCAHIFWPESQTGNKAARTMVIQRLISLLTWQEEGEGKGEREGERSPGVGGNLAHCMWKAWCFWCSQQFLFFPSGSYHPIYFLKDSLPTVQFSHSVVSNYLWPPWTAACQASLSITNLHSLLKLMSSELVMPSIHLILCRPLLPPSIFSSIRVFSNESGLHIR